MVPQWACLCIGSKLSQNLLDAERLLTFGVRLGFEEVGRLEIPLRDFGGSGTHVHGEWVFDHTLI